jgi:FkbM family methyltransferase
MTPTLYLKSLFVNSPLEGVAKAVHKITGIRYLLSHPELTELFLEERRLPAILSKLLSPSSNAIDIGCHIGSFLSQIARYSPQGNHIAIEASPIKVKLLRKRFPNVRIEQIAISDRVGIAVFEEDLDLPGFSKLAGTASSTNRVNRFDVQVTTLDALNIPGKIDFVKIDIEGAELAAFRGGRGFFGKNKPAILFECGADSNPDLDRRNLFEELTNQLGYDIFTFTDFLYDKGPLRFEEFKKCGIYPFRAFNFLALPSHTLPR